MARLPILSSDEVVKALKRAGFAPAPKRGKGSHVAMQGKDPTGRVRLVIIPKRKSLRRGTVQSILDQAGLTRDELLNLLR
ncbi:MAG: hypothetical protein B1H03_03630 [Planctomycetales bacterium 4484_113]|nr:MAG: hypothetical protein B1H03_03630 [Planctomycetales bacterium 4484_113]